MVNQTPMMGTLPPSLADLTLVWCRDSKRRQQLYSSYLQQIGLRSVRKRNRKVEKEYLDRKAKLEVPNLHEEN